MRVFRDGNKKENNQMVGRTVTINAKRAMLSQKKRHAREREKEKERKWERERK